MRDDEHPHPFHMPSPPPRAHIRRAERLHYRVLNMTDASNTVAAGSKYALPYGVSKY